MANVDRPNGFRLVKTFSGAPLASVIRVIGVADGADLFIGDALNLESNLAAVGATNDNDFLGVAVGFGKKNDLSNEVGGPFNPDNLNKRFYDDSENTHTDWVVYYVPADDGIFEVQTATALDLEIGDTADLSAGSGSTTTGISGHEITTNTNGDVTVVGIPKYPNNDKDLVNGRYWVMFTRASQAFHA